MIYLECVYYALSGLTVVYLLTMGLLIHNVNWP